MGIFDRIKTAIFGKAKADTVAPAPGAVVPPAGTGAGETTSAPMSSATGQVDVAPILDKAVKESGENLAWKTSIVDLLKALKIDSSLTARKELAHELGYTGDTNDSATMNIWLHKAVIKKLSENGGKVPKELLD